MQHDGKLEYCPFRGPLFIKKQEEIEKLLQNNHKSVSIPKYFNKKTGTSSSAPPKDKITRNQPKINSVRFEYPHDQINPMENTNDDTQLIDLNK